MPVKSSRYVVILVSYLFVIFPFTIALADTRQYEDLLEHRLGFGANVVGGAGGEVVIINDLKESTLRAALESDGPKWIRFGVSGTIRMTGKTRIKSYKTIDGRDADITITGPNGCPEWWFWDNATDLIIHNLKFDSIGEGDNCGIGFDASFGAHDVWIDHNTFTNLGDESIATGIGGGANMTVSWNYFHDTPKGTLLGWSGNNPEDSAIALTGHHNFYSDVGGRMPKLRRGKVHYFNNYARRWGWSAAEISTYGQFRSENNIWERGSRTAPAIWATDHGESAIGYARSSGDWFINGATTSGEGMSQGSVFDAREYYDYQLQPANEKLRMLVMNHAGWSVNPQWPDETSDVAGIGGRAVNIAPRKVLCTNLETRQWVVNNNPGNQWDCSALGLSAKWGDRVRAIVLGTALRPNVKGVLVGTTRPRSFTCANISRDQKRRKRFGTRKWSCAALETDIRKGDQIKVVLNGRAGRP